MTRVSGLLQGMQRKLRALAAPVDTCTGCEPQTLLLKDHTPASRVHHDGAVPHVLPWSLIELTCVAPREVALDYFLSLY